MFNNPGFLLTVGLILFAIVLVLVDRHYGERMRTLTNMDCCSRLDALEMVSTEQQKQISFLVAALQRSGVIQNDLERQLRELMARNSVVTAIPSLQAPDLIKPLMLICGDDEEMCNNDRQALRRAGIAFQRLAHASKRVVEDELRRRRQDNTLYRWVHVTAHAGPLGIQLASELADPSWWGRTFDGIEVMFLAACETSTVADELAGMMTVIFMQQEVNERDAADFTYAFWSQMAERKTPIEAYRNALRTVPAVAEFVDFRRN